MKFKLIHVGPALLAVIFSCQSKNNSDKVKSESIGVHDTLSKPRVKIYTCGLANFQNELLANGKVYAMQKADVKFPLNYSITSIYVQNGQQVQKGQLLAQLDEEVIRQKLERGMEALERSKVELDDKLIDYGYRLADTAKTPAGILKMAKIKSGYAEALFNYKEAIKELSLTKITAPFSGKIAGMEAKAFNTPDSYKKLCSVISDQEMTAEFNILESERKQIRIGMPVEIKAFDDAAKSYRGSITTINPAIDENGMIKVQARLGNTNGYLLDGMSVKIVAQNATVQQLLVPKEAVVERQGKNVLFTYENGKAKWNYITCGSRNSDYIVITSGLQPGQQVIISNTFNLAHDADVIIE